MQIKLTLIATRRKTHIEITDDSYFEIFFTNDKKIPNTYITRHDEKKTLQTLVDKYFYCGVEWLCPELLAFRKTNDKEFEVIYSSYMPYVSDINKSGIFISDQKLEENEIEIDPYYEELLSKKSRGF